MGLALALTRQNPGFTKPAVASPFYTLQGRFHRSWEPKVSHRFG